MESKYSKWYFELMTSRPVREDTYLEKHHIIPKCVGGSDDEENLILLTPREHFIAHLLLTKMYEGEARHKLLYAFNMMFVRSSKNRLRGNFNSKLYESIRKEAHQHFGKHGRKGRPAWNRGMTRSQAVKDAVSKANKGRTAWNKGVPRTEEDKAKMRAGWAKKLGK